MPAPLPSRFPFSPYPIGWYRVAWSADVRPGDVKPLCHFGVDLVLFRGAGGAPHVLDAHCPHVGAHLGYGGCVVDDTIQCPFHGWRMNGNGKCVIVPYADKVPPRAQVQSWPVREVNGAILVHYHPERAAPAWEPAVFDATDHPEWTRALHPHHWRLRSHVHEFGENAVDLSDAGHLHRHFTRSAKTVSVESEGPLLRHLTAHTYSVFGLIERLGREVTGSIETTCHGLGCIVNHAWVDAGMKLEYLVVFYPTPVDQERVELHVAVAMRKLKSRIATALLLHKCANETVTTIEQDVPIWEHKQFRSKPLLVEGEHAVMDYRRWARQFFVEGKS